jgi:hypothetical protein
VSNAKAKRSQGRGIKSIEGAVSVPDARCAESHVCNAKRAAWAFYAGDGPTRRHRRGVCSFSITAGASATVASRS